LFGVRGDMKLETLRDRYNEDEIAKLIKKNRR